MNLPRGYDQLQVDHPGPRGLTDGIISGRAAAIAKHRQRRIDLKEEILIFGSPSFGDNQLHWGDNPENRNQGNSDEAWKTAGIGKFSVSESDVNLRQTSDKKTTPLGLSPLNVNTAARLMGQSTGNSYTLTIGKTK